MREREIESRLKHVRTSGQWPSEMRAIYAEKKGTANSLVHWDRMSSEVLEAALHRIPRGHMAGIFDRLSRDIKANKTGFPDLIVFPADSFDRSVKDGGGIWGGEGGLDVGEPYALLEVKSPGDQLQKNQRRWMRYFDLLSIPYRLVNVVWR